MDPSTAAMAAATITTAIIAAAIITVPTAIIGAVFIAAVVVIAIAAQDAAQHARDEAADQGFGNKVAAITNLFDPRVRPNPIRKRNAGEPGRGGRRHQHHPEASHGRNLNMIHPTIL
jgi:hypothetical protein